MTKQDVQWLLWFGAGFVLAAVLSVSYEAVRFIPMAAAFGLLCFCCGLVLMQFLALRRQQEELARKRMDDATMWLRKSEELRQEKSKLEEAKEAWKAEKEIWEVRRKEWDDDKESAWWVEYARMSKEEPERLSAFHKEILRIAECEAARRGGEQIDRDTDASTDEPDEEESN